MSHIRLRCDKFYTVVSFPSISTVAHFTVTASSCRPGHAFMQSLADKEQLVAPVKERGNINYKQLRYRASIADYTRAIKLWSVLIVYRRH